MIFEGVGGNRIYASILNKRYNGETGTIFTVRQNNGAEEVIDFCRNMFNHTPLKEIE